MECSGLQLISWCFESSQPHKDFGSGTSQLPSNFRNLCVSKFQPLKKKKKKKISPITVSVELSAGVYLGLQELDFSDSNQNKVVSVTEAFIFHALCPAF